MQSSLSSGRRGAVAAAHPLAVSAGLEMLARGGNAVDAAIAAQAVLCVVLPDACGLGGDALILVRDPSGTTAVNGVGRSALAASSAATDGAGAVTVPGIVGAWGELAVRWGTLGLAAVLEPAIAAARDGAPLGAPTAGARDAQRARLLRGGAGAWSLMELGAGDLWLQPELAAVLERIAAESADAFYTGSLAEAVAAATRRDGGALAAADLAGHRTEVLDPVTVGWDSGTAHVQPPTTQGVLLAMALQWLDARDAGADDHVGVELTEACFTHRDSVIARGTQLLGEPLEVDEVRAARRGGPRAYLHTAGVATADATGLVVSSLVSVFDDFGAGTFVPEGGFVLNNRAGGFTVAPNEFAPGKAPVHTLAPALLERPDGPVAVATPGADGQVQTLLQVLSHRRWDGGQRSWERSVDAPRWRSEGGALLVERGHPAAAALRERGHDVLELEPGDARFGAVVCAGIVDGVPFAVGDWRREVSTGAL